MGQLEYAGCVVLLMPTFALMSTLRFTLRHVLAASVVVVALVLAIVLFPWHLLRGSLARYAGYQLQREVTIGDLDVSFGRITRVRLDDVSVGNAPWFGEWWGRA